MWLCSLLFFSVIHLKKQETVHKLLIKLAFLTQFCSIIENFPSHWSIIIIMIPVQCGIYPRIPQISGLIRDQTPAPSSLKLADKLLLLSPLSAASHGYSREKNSNATVKLFHTFYNRSPVCAVCHAVRYINQNGITSCKPWEPVKFK